MRSEGARSRDHAEGRELEDPLDLLRTAQRAIEILEEECESDAEGRAEEEGEDSVELVGRTEADPRRKRADGLTASSQ